MTLLSATCKEEKPHFRADKIIMIVVEYVFKEGAFTFSPRASSQIPMFNQSVLITSTVQTTVSFSVCGITWPLEDLFSVLAAKGSAS